MNQTLRSFNFVLLKEITKNSHLQYVHRMGNETLSKEV
jgi:hypothetical protein